MWCLSLFSLPSGSLCHLVRACYWQESNKALQYGCAILCSVLWVRPDPELGLGSLGSQISSALGWLRWLASVYPPSRDLRAWPAASSASSSSLSPGPRLLLQRAEPSLSCSLKPGTLASGSPALSASYLSFILYVESMLNSESFLD